MRREVGGGGEKGEVRKGEEERKMNREEGSEECGKGGRKGREEGRETGSNSSFISQGLQFYNAPLPPLHSPILVPRHPPILSGVIKHNHSLSLDK